MKNNDQKEDKEKEYLKEFTIDNETNENLSIINYTLTIDIYKNTIIDEEYSFTSAL